MEFNSEPISYLVHLGEVFCDFNIGDYEYEWATLYKGSYEECENKFLRDMINIFSSYGDDWGNIKLEDITSWKENNFELKTNGSMLIVSYEGAKNTFKSETASYDYEDNFIKVLAYGTTGGLRLSFAALVISEETLIKYCHNLNKSKLRKINM